MVSIHFNQAQFLSAAHTPDQWPAASGPEVAFAGRSNVGKSSAINVIAGRQGLAKTSKTPGRTQQIVFFRLPDSGFLVDLPGYGYARVPEHMRKHWESLVMGYLSHRQMLRALFIPMDIRRPLTRLDRAMLNCCGEVGLPAHILLTKADKYKQGRAMNIYRSVCKELEPHAGTTVQLFSARTRLGVEEAREILTGFLSPDDGSVC